MIGTEKNERIIQVDGARSLRTWLGLCRHSVAGFPILSNDTSIGSFFQIPNSATSKVPGELALRLLNHAVVFTGSTRLPVIKSERQKEDLAFECGQVSAVVDVKGCSAEHERGNGLYTCGFSFNKAILGFTKMHNFHLKL